MDINTCFETTHDYRVIALYSHLIPLLLTVVLSIFVLVKSNFSLRAKVFCLFTTSFCLWLLGDVVAWTSNDYNLISFFWVQLDYINIIFYLFGAYFFSMIVKERDISFTQKVFLLVLSLPALWITVTYQSIDSFYQPVCEALNNEFLSTYKLIVETIIILFIFILSIIELQKGEKKKRLQIITISSALVLFFGVFSVTEYISSQTGVYEINLYSLFTLPIFLFMMIYAITSLEIFRIRLIGSQLLAYMLVIMVGSQFFFLQNTTDRTLTGITLIMSLGFGVLLVRSGRREERARTKVEKLAAELETANVQLKELDKQKDELISIVSHQLATPVSSVKWYLEMMLDGDIGKLTEEQATHVKTLQSVVSDLADLVSMILDVSRIQLGKMRVDKAQVNLGEFFNEILAVIKPKAEQRPVELHVSLPKNLPTAMLDKRLLRITLENLLSNAVKYTPEKGSVYLDVVIKDKKLLYTVKDTGYGIPVSEQDKIFGKLFRASNVQKIDGNGFGLFAAKGAVEAQKGTIRFESKEGKGTTFFVEIPLE